MEQRIRRRRRKTIELRAIILLVLTLVLIIYIGISLYFTKHFLFNTYVNDIDAQNMTASDIEEVVTSELKKYVLTVNGRGDVTDTISADEAGLSLQMDDQFEEALASQNSFLWPAYLFKEDHITTDNIVVYSADTIEALVENLSIFSTENIIEPVDAYISDEIGEEGFYIVSEEAGQKPVKEKVIAEISEALDILDAELELSDECYENANVLSDNAELNELCNNLNQYCRAVITYEFGSDIVTVDGTVIKEWCDIDGTQVSLDETKVRDFVNSIARQYDTFGTTRTLISYTGETVEVSGGDYGWWMDRTTETSELIEQIKAGEKTTRTPVYFGTAAEYGDTDWGSSYVEINLTKQHLWVFVDGVMKEESDFVSGCVNKGTCTPTGTYGITYKERDATLVGENYESPVSYWMPFNGNVGMHDASWRSEFGGELYVTSGSHGCINLPVDKAA
ncbi:MAG: L,D-transpeptidase/peptidoglycan binding protein, partial [Butyrivibrio sp.]|nr:L,D-transpeptidase/peptidoglycan binding protein [Butyrivibrio sp.]